MNSTTIPLSELMVKSSSSIDPSQHPDETFELYSIPAFDSGCPEYVKGAQIGSTKQIVAEDDVLLSKIVPHIRRTWIVQKSQGSRQIASGEWIVFRSTKTHPGYLRHVLKSDTFHRKFMQTVSGVGGSLLRARPSHVANICIPCPEYRDQQCIAAILDKAEELRAARRKAIEKLDELERAVFHEMFGDPVKNKKGYPEYMIGEICHQNTNNGIFRKNDEYCDNGLPVIWVDSLFKGSPLSTSTSRYLHSNTNMIKKYGLKNGDLLFCRSSLKREGVAYCNYYEGDDNVALFECHIIRVSPNKKLVNPAFICTQLRFPQLRKKAISISKTSTMTTINRESLLSLSVICPPIQEQERYAEYLRETAAEKNTMIKSLANMDYFFSSLQHRAFAGEL